MAPSGGALDLSTLELGGAGVGLVLLVIAGVYLISRR
jgi:hypothetical protein